MAAAMRHCRLLLLQESFPCLREEDNDSAPHTKLIVCSYQDSDLIAFRPFHSHAHSSTAPIPIPTITGTGQRSGDPVPGSYLYETVRKFSIRNPNQGKAREPESTPSAGPRPNYVVLCQVCYTGKSTPGAIHFLNLEREN